MTGPQMSPAQEVFAAAARLRERAEDATPAEIGWSGVGDDRTGEAMLFGGPVEDGYRTGTVFWFRQECQECTPPSQADVAWMEIVDPGLAEPLAAWLEALARGWEMSMTIAPGGCDIRYASHPGLAVARAINGSAR